MDRCPILPALADRRRLLSSRSSSMPASFQFCLQAASLQCREAQSLVLIGMHRAAGKAIRCHIISTVPRNHTVKTSFFTRSEVSTLKRPVQRAAIWINILGISYTLRDCRDNLPKYRFSATLGKSVSCDAISKQQARYSALSHTLQAQYSALGHTLQVRYSTLGHTLQA